MAKGLGRGLDGLFEDNSPIMAESNENKMTLISISDIEPSREQPRKAFDKDALEELASSIATQGLLQPLIARPLDDGRYKIVSGERRWRAARMAGLKEVPVIIKDLTDKEALEIGLIENLQREDLNIVEEAKGYKALIEEFSLTQEEVAERVGKSRPAVANAMRILVLPDEVLQMALDGKLSSGHARAMIPLFERSESVEKFIALAKMIADKGLTVREVENMAKKKRTLKKNRQAKKDEIYFREVGERLSRNFGRKIKVNPSDRPKSKVKGTVVFEYYSNDDFNNLIAMLTKEGEE